VRIRFDPESVKMLRGKTWHATQEIHGLPNGCADVTFRTADEWTIVQWVLSWGAHAWVVEPSQLRSWVREIAREIVARH
jgi:proteasome accessory factor B